MRTLSLASGTLPEFAPVEVVRAAAAAGFAASGIWYDAATWTDAITRAVRDAFRATGIAPLEIEVIILGNAADSAGHYRLLDAGAAIGATEAIVVSTEADVHACAAAFAPLCRHAAERGINMCLEFLPIFAIRDLATALRVLELVNQSNAKLLIDPVHLARAGSTPADLAALPATLFSFAQFCDAPAALHEPTYAALFEEAVHGRLDPGEGELPLAALLDVLPQHIPLSLEMRSRRLRERFPTATERARHVYCAAANYLAGDVQTTASVPESDPGRTTGAPHP